MIINMNADRLNYEKDLLVFALLDKDYLNIDAIFSDETENFISNPEPAVGETLTITIRTAKNNVDAVYLHTSDGKIEAIKISSDDLFDYYGITLAISHKIKYYFSIKKNGMIYYYNKRGLYKEADLNFNFMLIPGFKTPDWAKGAVMYQIYVDRFHNGDKANDTVDYEYLYMGKAAKHVADWNKPLDNLDICNFYGGDLKGVMDKMSYLKELGIEVIYFNPIFVSPSNHKYDTQDYDYVDPHYGVIVKDGGAPLNFEHLHNRYATMYMQRTTNKENLEASNQLMISLIALAHQNGIRVILDGVFNHCGAFNKWLDRENFYGQSGYPQGAYRDKNSQYKNYFRWYDDAWPNNECYDSWWGHDNHPKLYFEGSQELYDYILHVGRKWVSAPYNADGWRLDVAADLGHSVEFNHKFWKDFRSAVKTANPNAIILAEHYGDASDWLGGDQWDTVMNYDAFMDPVTWFFTGMEKHSEEFKPDMLCNTASFEASMRYYMSRFPMQALQTAMNELSNHDHSRFLTRTNMTVGRLHTVGAELADQKLNKSIMMAAVAMQMTWPGAPTVYYGDEAGVAGWTDPDNRRTYPWGREDKTLLEFHKQMIAIHKKYQSLKTGSLEFLFMDYGVISYARWNKSERIVCAFNNNAEAREITIPVWRANVPLKASLKQIIATHGEQYTVEKIYHTVSGGAVKLTMPPFSGIVLLHE